MVFRPGEPECERPRLALARVQRAARDQQDEVGDLGGGVSHTGHRGNVRIGVGCLACVCVCCMRAVECVRMKELSARKPFPFYFLKPKLLLEKLKLRDGRHTEPTR